MSRLSTYQLSISIKNDENDDKTERAVSREDLQLFGIIVDVRVLNYKVKWLHSTIEVFVHCNMQADIAGHSQRNDTGNISYHTQYTYTQSTSEMSVSLYSHVFSPARKLRTCICGLACTTFAATRSVLWVRNASEMHLWSEVSFKSYWGSLQNNNRNTL